MVRSYGFRPGGPPRALAERFWEKVQKGDGCWLWLGYRAANGYGRFHGAEHRAVWAHRVVYELTRGAIPPGMEVCHSCDNPPCVNPAHLWLGTMADNQADKVRKGRLVNPLTDALRAQTHCKRGHPLSGDNLYVRSTGYRMCRTCNKSYRQHRAG